MQQLFWCFRSERVCPCLSIHTFTWLDCWMVIWMINFLTWKSRGCWGRRAWRSWVQTKNHDGYEIFSIALYSNIISNEMWFWPLILSYEYPCSSQSFPSDRRRILEEFHRQKYMQLSDVHGSLFIRLHFTLAVITVIGLLDVVTVSNSGELKSFFADHVHRRSGVYNKFSFLKF